MATFCADCGKNITNQPANGPSHECREQRAANRRAQAEARKASGDVPRNRKGMRGAFASGRKNS